MASQDNKDIGGGGRALPKFGEWDVNNPASAEGFTVIFQKARDEKNTATIAPPITTQSAVSNKKNGNTKGHKRWFCLGG